jgi:hypothetical protein
VPLAAKGPGLGWLVGLGFVGGMERFEQTVDPPGDYAPNALGTGPELGSRLGVSLAGGVRDTSIAHPRPVRVGVDFDLLGTAAPQFDGSLVMTIGVRRAWFGLGGAMATVRRFEGSETRLAQLGVPTLALRGLMGPVDLGVEGGYVPALTRAVARAGVANRAPHAEHRLRYRVGLEGRLRTAHYVQTIASSPSGPALEDVRTLDATDLSVLGEVGVVWGAW